MRFVRTAAAVLAAVAATALAVPLGAVLLGAYVPAIPKAGMVGTVLAGQWPLHLAAFASVALLPAMAARRLGLPRWGKALTALTAASTVAALVVAATQTYAAVAAGTRIAWTDVATELALPAVTPDETVVHPTSSGYPLAVDVYLPPAGGAPAAAVVLAHAGGFRTFDRTDLRGTARWLADHGVAAFAVEYRLATATTPTWDQAPQDLVCALERVRAEAARYRIDPARVALGGMSAGGTLALGAAYRLAQGAITSSCGAVPGPPAAVVGFYCGADVGEMYAADVDGSREAATWFTGGTPQQYPERYRTVSPTTYVRPGLMRTLLVAAGSDHGARPEMVTGFADELTRHGVDVRAEVLPFAPHAFDDAYGSIAAQHSRQLLLDFLTAR